MNKKNLAIIFSLSFLLIQSISVLSASSRTILHKRAAREVFLGIQSEHISEGKAKLLKLDNPHGSYVTKIIKGTSAEKAGLKVLDYLIGIDNIRVNDNRDFSDLLKVYDAGQAAVVHFYRLGKPMKLEVTFGNPDDDDNNNSSKTFLGVNQEGDDNDDDDDPKLGVKVSVVNGSSADKMGLENGDIVLTINGYPIVDWTDLTALVSSTAPESDVTIEVQRKGQQLSITGKIGKKGDGEDNAKRSYSSYIWKDNGERNYSQRSSGFLGIYSNEVSREKAKKLSYDNPYGSMVTKVIPKSAAEKVGILPFDYIFGVDDHRVSADQTLTSILRKYQPSDKVTLHLIRKGQELVLPFEMGERVEDFNMNFSSSNDPFLGVQEWRNSSDQGVAVDVLSGTTAEEMGLKDGDVITAINGNRIIEWSDISIAINVLKPGEMVAVDYLREGKKGTASKPIKSSKETRWNENWASSWSVGSSNNRRPVNPEIDQTKRERPENLKTQIADLETAEFDKMKSQFNIDLPRTNSLKIEKIELFPNTAIGLFKLQFELPEKGATNIRVFNSVGRNIYEYDLGQFSGQFSDDIDISQNGAGVYYLEILQGDKSICKKIVLLQ
jgi:S1-C subfamily serine protease